MTMIGQNIPTFEYAGRAATLIRTDALLPGVRVILATAGIASKAPVIRTVESVTDSGQANRSGNPLFTVRWVEGRTDDWSGANVSNAEFLWTIVV
jgi:hypothetical protein